MSDKYMAQDLLTEYQEKIKANIGDEICVIGTA